MNFLRLRPLFFLISSLVILSGVYSYLKFGFNIGIDFTGGSVLELSFSKPVTQEQLKADLQKESLSLYTFESLPNNQVNLKTNPVTPEQKIKLDTMFKKFDPKYQELKFETQGPALGRELIFKTIVAVILATLTILIFIARSFKDATFGIGAVLAMFHDVLVLLGSFSILGHLYGAQVDSLFVTAVLTTLSSSIHDTVVTFDRIRELKQTESNHDIKYLANKALNQTFIRSYNNSFTIIIMLVSLTLIGASSTRWFGAALLIGALTGTYSSFAVAVPLVVWLKSKKIKLRHPEIVSGSI